jgi:hypothetical protein
VLNRGYRHRRGRKGLFRRIADQHPAFEITLLKKVAVLPVPFGALPGMP